MKREALDNVREGKIVRVLHFLPSLSAVSGVVSIVTQYQRFMDPHRIAFDYLCFQNEEPSVKAEVEMLGSRCFCYPLRRGVFPGDALRGFLKENGAAFDILHCHPIFGAELLGRTARKHGISHVIAHSHSTQYSNMASSRIRNAVLAKFVGFCATDYIACSPEASTLHGRHSSEAFILHNAIDCERFRFDISARMAVRKELGVSDGCLLLGTLGRLAPEKNHRFALDVASCLMARGVDFKLAIAGDGPLHADLLREAKASGLENRVLLLGGRKDAPNLYSSFDVFLLPSLFEGIPVAAVEAQASGLPCLLSDAVNPVALFGSGKMLPVNEGPEIWADALEGLILPSPDDRLGGAAATKKAGFDLRAESVRLMDYYESIVRRGRR